MHNFGINLSHLGTIAFLTKHQHIKEICTSEMAARVCKKIFRNNIKDAIFNF